MGKRLTEKEYNEIYSKVPRFCVDLIVKSDKGVLLCKRGIEPHIGIWHMPGGTVMYGESLEQAVKRVAKEEICSDVDVLKQLGVVEYSEEIAFGWVKAAFYLVRAKSEPKAGERTLEVRWFEKLPDHIVPEQKEFLEKNKLPAKSGFGIAKGTGLKKERIKGSGLD